MNKLTLIVLVALFFQSCATIFSSTSQMVHISSKPDSARIEIDGISYGYTPKDVFLKKRVDKPMMVLSRKGYESKSFQLQTSVNGVTFFNLLFWPGFLIDLATGAIVKYDPAVYDIEMDAKK